MSDVSRLSLRGLDDVAPPELYGYVYDIPKDAGLTNKDLTEIFKENHIECIAQIQRNENKPFFTAKVKFMNGVHLQVAAEKMRFFKLDRANGNNREVRFIQHIPILSKKQDPSVGGTIVKNPDISQSLIVADDQSENLPDNSFRQTNLCVLGLDESITGEDLHGIFSKYGEIKSVKVSLDAKTSKSNCRGFVWFMNEDSCLRALNESKHYM